MDSGEKRRIDDLMDLLLRLAGGDLSARGVPSYANDELDAIITGVNMLAEELTERERALQRAAHQRQQASKLEALGILAGGIAHDFNNILAAIIGNAELPALQQFDEATVRKSIDEIRGSAERAAGLVKQILAFCRLEPARLVCLNLSQTVAEALTIVRASLPSNIELRYEGLRPDPYINGDAGQIAQVVLNLCTNARQALAGSEGVIEVSLTRQGRGTVAQPHGPAAVSGTLAADCVLLKVADNGCGIDDHIQESMFDPFFTTREIGEGTGLGLAVVLGIVKQHGGRVAVESQPGKGACITVAFPALNRGGAPSVQSGSGSRETKARAPIRRRILVVDDEPALRNILRSLLETRGHVVTTSESAEQALDNVRSSRAHFDLVLTDQTMRGLSGSQLASALKEIRPQLPVILLSGFGVADEDPASPPEGVALRLSKPVRARELFEAIDACTAPQATPRNHIGAGRSRAPRS